MSTDCTDTFQVWLSPTLFGYLYLRNVRPRRVSSLGCSWTKKKRLLPAQLAFELLVSWVIILEVIPHVTLKSSTPQSCGFGRLEQVHWWFWLKRAEFLDITWWALADGNFLCPSKCSHYAGVHLSWKPKESEKILKRMWGISLILFLQSVGSYPQFLLRCAPRYCFAWVIYLVRVTLYLSIKTNLLYSFHERVIQCQHSPIITRKPIVHRYQGCFERLSRKFKLFS
jgi:hypothetical protein